MNSDSERLRKAIDICSELALARTIRDICNDTVQLIGDQLMFERIGIALSECPDDVHRPFYGIDVLGKDITHLEAVSAVYADPNIKLTLTRGRPFIIPQIYIPEKENHGEKTRADRLLTPIRGRNNKYYGYLIADRLEEDGRWEDDTIELFRLLATFLASRIATKKLEFKQSKERLMLRTLIDALPNFIYAKDLDSKFLLVNQKMADEMKAESLKAMIGTCDHDYFPKTLADKYRNDEKNVIEQGQALVNLEEQSIDRNGNTKWILSTKIPVRNELGQIFCMVGSGIDITERKLFEQQIKESETRFRTLFRSIGDAIIAHDKTGKILDCNDTACTLFGLPRKTFLKQTISSINFPEYQEKIDQGLHDKQKIRATFFQSDEHPISMDIRVSSFQHEDQNAFLALMRDVTELEQAKLDAEAAARTKSAFLANMSHEIRTPLNAVIGMTSLLEDTKMSDEQYDFAKTIRTSGESLLDIINEILDISKIEAGEMHLECAPFNLQSCVESALDIVSVKAAEKSLELTYGIFGDLPHAFFGDEARLRQVLLNLLSNSIKFTEAGEVVVRINGTPFGNDRYRINFAVADTGIGMTEEQTKIIFNPFQQADYSTTRKYGGTGLGLSICSHLIEMMGGDISVTSQPGKGSEFSFYITMKPSEAAGCEPEMHPEVLRGKSALIVDDNLTNLQILEYQLRKWGVNTHPYERPKEALEALSTLGPIDIAILDMVMPEMDGLMLSEALRQSTEMKDRPIMILSSISQPPRIPKKLIDAWLPKPTKQRLLCTAICNLISGKTKTKPVRQHQTEEMDHNLGKEHPLRILVAEDNRVNQIVIMKLLRRLGYEADLVENGLEVLDAVRDKVFDLILMDIQMPEMDGIEATIQLQKIYGPTERPTVIALTAHALHDDKVKSLKIGMSDYVTKPVRIEELIKAIRNVERRPV
jgi:PAS domain S-box-containing protein